MCCCVASSSNTSSKLKVRRRGFAHNTLGPATCRGLPLPAQHVTEGKLGLCHSLGLDVMLVNCANRRKCNIMQVNCSAVSRVSLLEGVAGSLFTDGRMRTTTCALRSTPSGYTGSLTDRACTGGHAARSPSGLLSLHTRGCSTMNSGFKNDAVPQHLYAIRHFGHFAAHGAGSVVQVAAALSSNGCGR
jgi:hypothetical protein